MGGALALAAAADALPAVRERVVDVYDRLVGGDSAPATPEGGGPEAGDGP
jgi:hypothetical protein